jgi:hypothetical protein
MLEIALGHGYAFAVLLSKEWREDCGISGTAMAFDLRKVFTGQHTSV